MHCANFPRHLGRLITRCLIAHPNGADTMLLAVDQSTISRLAAKRAASQAAAA
jgi:hypothetical protein